MARKAVFQSRFRIRHLSLASRSYNHCDILYSSHHRVVSGIYLAWRENGDSSISTIDVLNATNTYTCVGSSPISCSDPLGLRDVIVAIWYGTSPWHLGHVFVGEMNGDVILSQFPDPHGMVGPSKTFSWSRTLEEEGKDPDGVYQVHINDQPFDAEAKSEAAKPKWFVFETATTTKCSSSAYHALLAGGVNAMDLGAGVLPDTLAKTLDDLAGFENGVTRLNGVPW